ncbi:hypothetical protein GIB67_019134 [Kingdonia uniflora]|uniref:VLRF1 domain-containing protein n=1 Tax=Kingdonia uniflora TaxID=39325 RepID=A0A7J7MZK6_9MAGN|nr:hypothetical protein GIB67_019134 [Kingdonia uniflora]
MNSSSTNNQSEQKRLFRSLFDLPLDFFDSCRLLHDGSSSLSEPFETSSSSNPINDNQQILESEEEVKMKNLTRWSCNTCKVEFDSLQDQRSHFKSDLHRFNVKLCIAGKDTIKEEDFDEAASDSLFKDNDISSISGSEDEADKGLFSSSDAHRKTGETNKQKLFICLRTGDVVSIWRSLLMNDNENISYDNDNVVMEVSRGHLKENELIGRLNSFVHEPRDKTHLRIVLLASGGHFAGCVFDGSSVVAHKTFHRYVVRAKAGRKQSSKDASGKAASSAGASLRRYNELALKKEIQELLASWKPYFDASSCVFIYAPSNNRQLLFSGEKPLFSNSHFMIRHFPFTVRRPTCKEAKRMYNHLTVMAYEDIVKRSPSSTIEDILIGVTSIGSGSLETSEEMPWTQFESKENVEACKNIESLDTLSISSDSGVLGTSTLLHKAVMSGNTQETLELLEQGLDPCIKDERGRTPYMLATEKEVRNIFRRFMALNLEKWDWNSAKVPSPLTKEMEELQASKQVTLFTAYIY